MNIIHHYPVMYKTVCNKIQSMKFKRIFKIFDCTFGFGGHSHAILKKFPNAQIYGYEIDSRVMNYYKQHYAAELQISQRNRLSLSVANYTSISEYEGKFDVILGDFGFNNYHLECANGFSWLKDTEIDMRYTQTNKKCSDIINSISKLQLSDILSTYGNLKQAKQLANIIYENRPIISTKQLKDITIGCFQNNKTTKIAQIFQSFRIITNNQLLEIQKLLNIIQYKINNQGLIIMITFHSGQRNIIYRKIKQINTIFSKIKTYLPSKQQLEQNNKSHSAKMLIFNKL